jgi:predicted flap endonuclease-1-like 5' DNA nuclease
MSATKAVKAPAKSSKQLRAEARATKPGKGTAAKPTPTPTDGAKSGHVGALELEGIGPVFAKKLAKAGIKDSQALLAADPKALAAETGIPEASVRTWRSMAALLPVKGVGPQFAEVLVRTGIESVVDLADCDADKLTARITALLDSKAVTIVGATITEKRVASWIAEANKLVDKPAESSPAAIRKAVHSAIEAKQDAATPAKAKKGRRTRSPSRPSRTPPHRRPPCASRRRPASSPPRSSRPPPTPCRGR